MRNKVIELGVKEFSKLTQAALRSTQIEFGGFLVREDSDAIYVADMQGTWVIPRNSVQRLEDWELPKNSEVNSIPEYMKKAGRPVRVAVSEGATIYEIRPWQIEKMKMGDDARNAVEKIFTLGGAPLPIGENTKIGETQLGELERAFSRRLGWDPDDPGDRQQQIVYCAASGTWYVCRGHYHSDCDKPF